MKRGDWCWQDAVMLCCLPCQLNCRLGYRTCICWRSDHNCSFELLNCAARNRIIGTCVSSGCNINPTLFSNRREDGRVTSRLGKITSPLRLFFWNVKGNSPIAAGSGDSDCKFS
jgi:hypothetical protein